MVVHALGELLGGGRAVAAELLAGSLVLGGLDLLLLGLGGGGGAAAEEAADGMADGGTDRDTAVEEELACVFGRGRRCG